MNTTALSALARELTAPGKGILAADESGPTIEKRFTAAGIASTAETRRAYRELLFAAPGLGACVSGVILHDETLRQSAADGTPLVELLRRQGMIPGVKVDLGAKPLAGFPGEKITEGLDGLRERLADYAGRGARFVKWRAVIALGDGRPSPTCIAANAEALARYAALSQEAGLVPIVEPEVLMDGAHPLERHGEVTAATQRRVFRALAAHRVELAAMLLKPNMVLAGTTYPQQADTGAAAAATLAVLLRTVPPAVPGIVFLSGGQEEIGATKHLDALNRLGGAPWELSFSFGRALQASALKLWAGRAENVPAAQAALLKRARCNSAARSGRYTPEMEEKS